MTLILFTDSLGLQTGNGRISSLSLAPTRSEDQPRPRSPNHPQYTRKVLNQSRSLPRCASDPPLSSTWSSIKSSRQRPITASVSTPLNGASPFPTTCRYLRPICPPNYSGKSILISKTIIRLRQRSMRSTVGTKSCNCTSLRPSIGKSDKAST